MNSIEILLICLSEVFQVDNGFLCVDDKGNRCLCFKGTDYK
jgi:hypothetical protein